MASKTIISYGATVERSTDGTVFTAIPEAKGIAVPTLTQEFPEVTSLSSPDGFREYIKGLKDLGEITVAANYTSAGWAQQVADRDANAAITYRVTLKPAPDQTTGDVFIYEGFPVPSPVDNGIGEALGMDIVIRTTGSVAWTAGTAV